MCMAKISTVGNNRPNPLYPVFVRGLDMHVQRLRGMNASSRSYCLRYAPFGTDPLVTLPTSLLTVYAVPDIDGINCLPVVAIVKGPATWTHTSDSDANFDKIHIIESTKQGLTLDTRGTEHCTSC